MRKDLTIRFIKQWYHLRRRRRELIVNMLAYYFSAFVYKTPKHTSILRGPMWVDEVVTGNPPNVVEMLRMPRVVFQRLAHAIVDIGKLRSTQEVSVNEQLAMFLCFCGHHASSRALQCRFQRSGETITRHLRAVLKAVRRWEGTAGDGKLYEAALRSGLTVPANAYNILDAGFALTKSCLTPYRGTRYHLKEYGKGSQRPRNKEELFNLRHAQLRNVVERIFGIVKKRFPVMSYPVEYDYQFQVVLVMALYDFEHQADADLQAQIQQPLLPEDQSNESVELESEEAKRWRDDIARRMWDQYMATLRNSRRRQSA
ncbi:hypothetical protein AaE_012395 [Aphanomyces astaci]|uniref:Uncharacterized protein n=1 Tax=Aphanomyces astaci TaxID=112090 RepID=A0A6A4ZG48_APHAT|nr:hypothetical protein AaE_012395 [Aphanomyces astaci]